MPQVDDTYSDGFTCMRQACEIFQTYSPERGRYAPFHCEHDKLTVIGPEPSEITEEHVAELERLGFIVPGRGQHVTDEDNDYDDEEYIYSYRFGSA